MLSSNIRYLRKTGGLSQTDFGKQFGLTRGMVDTYESGRSKPDPKTLSSIAEFYSVSVENLTQKDFVNNPADIFSTDNHNSTTADLLKEKDERIKELSRSNLFLQRQVEALTRQLSQDKILQNRR